MRKSGVNMNYEVDQVIQFKNGEYLILDVIKYKDFVYLYLINYNEYLNDTAIVKVVNNDKTSYEYIKNNEEFDYVLNKLFLNNSIDALKLVADE
jgi:hypothetical protein